MFYLTHGMYAAQEASMSLTQLRQSAESFCDWSIHEGHPLHAHSPFIETAANFLLKANLALDGTTVLGLGIAKDPGFKLELMQNGHYPPHVGALQIPSHSKYNFGRFVKHVERDPTHPLQLSATGFCKFDTLMKCYNEYFDDVTVPTFQAEHNTWVALNKQWNDGRGPDPGVEPVHPTSSDDEIDDAFLKSFKMFKSDHYDGDRIVTVVNGFCERAQQQVDGDMAELD